MRIDFIRHSLIAKPTASALLALCLIQSNVYASQPISIRAQTSGGFTLTFQGSLAGLARGQMLRLTGANGNEPGSRGGSEPVHARATLYDAHGDPIAESAEVEIPAGEFRSIDFDRDDLLLTGEPGTGRVQVRAQIRYRFFSIVDRTRLSPPSLEIIDKTNGMTTVAYRANDRLITSGPVNFALGIIPGQTLRFTMFNSSDPDSREGSDPIRARVKLFDAHGNLIAESPEVLIPAGEFHSFDFNYGDLPPAAEQGGRNEVRTRPLWMSNSTRSFGPDQIPASLEIVNNSTGTSALNIPYLVQREGDSQ